MSSTPDRMVGGRRYQFYTRRKNRRRAKTYAENAKYLGFLDSYRILRINNWWHVYGRSERKEK